MGRKFLSFHSERKKRTTSRGSLKLTVPFDFQTKSQDIWLNGRHSRTTLPHILTVLNEIT